MTREERIQHILRDDFIASRDLVVPVRVIYDRALPVSLPPAPQWRDVQ